MSHGDDAVPLYTTPRYQRPLTITSLQPTTYASIHDINMTEPQPAAPTRDSHLTYRKITEHNWRAVANLRLPLSQRGNLAANVWSLAEAAYSEDAWLRAIYANSTLVGFLMLAIWDPDCAYYIWRLMIDERYQGFGLRETGRAACG